MTYQEKRSIVAICSTILIFVSFSWLMYPRFPEAELQSMEMFRFWGRFVLYLTLVSIAAHIVISISFNIVFRITTKEKEPGFEDELDRIITLKSQRNSFFIFIIGFVLAMGSLLVYPNAQMMFVLLILAGFLSDLCGSISKLYYYRKGV